jgi:hypothetical protein
MITTKAAPDGGNVCANAPGADHRDNLVEEVPLEAEMAGKPSTRGNGAVVPAFCVDRIDAEELQVARIDLVLNGGHHAAVFKIEEPSAGCRKGQRGSTRVSEDEQFHLPPKGRG